MGEEEQMNQPTYESPEGQELVKTIKTLDPKAKVHTKKSIPDGYVEVTEKGRTVRYKVSEYQQLLKDKLDKLRMLPLDGSSNR